MTKLVAATVARVVTRRVPGPAPVYVLRDVRPEVAEDVVRRTWRSPTSTIWDGIHHHDLAQDAARLTPGLPVSFVHGDRDRAAPIEGTRALAAMLTPARMRVLPRADHHPVLRAPEGCVAPISAFENERSASRRGGT